MIGQAASANASIQPVSLARLLTTNLLMVAGAGLLEWTSAVHLHLWQNGYRGIPTIGSLFLAQAVSGFVLGALIALARRRPVALLGAGFMVATLGGLLVSIEFGLFGFKDSIHAPFAIESVAIEVAGSIVLALAALCAEARPVSAKESR